MSSSPPSSSAYSARTVTGSCAGPLRRSRTAPLEYEACWGVDGGVAVLCGSLPGFVTPFGRTGFGRPGHGTPGSAVGGFEVTRVKAEVTACRRARQRSRRVGGHGTGRSAGREWSPGAVLSGCVMFAIPARRAWRGEWRFVVKAWVACCRGFEVLFGSCLICFILIQVLQFGFYQINRLTFNRTTQEARLEGTRTLERNRCSFLTSVVT